MQEIIITGMKIGDYQVPVPHGLSELLNRAGAWSKTKRKNSLKGYHRKVDRVNGKLVTVLTHVDEMQKGA